MTGCGVGAGVPAALTSPSPRAQSPSPGCGLQEAGRAASQGRMEPHPWADALPTNSPPACRGPCCKHSRMEVRPLLSPLLSQHGKDGPCHPGARASAALACAALSPPAAETPAGLAPRAPAPWACHPPGQPPQQPSRWATGPPPRRLWGSRPKTACCARCLLARQGAFAS